MTDLKQKCSLNPKINHLRVAIENTLNSIIEKENLILSNKEELMLYLYNATTYIWGPAKILYNPNEEFLSISIIITKDSHKGSKKLYLVIFK